MKVGKGIRLLRTAKGLTQKQLAQEAGCSSNYLSLVERGDRNPSIGMVERLSAKLGVPADAVFALSVSPSAAHTPEDQMMIQRLKRVLLLLADSTD